MGRRPKHTIAKTWKQSKYPMTEEWIKKMWYIYIMKYYLDIENNEMMSFAADGPRDCHTELSKSEKEHCHMIPLICGILKDMIQRNLFIKQKQTHRPGEQTYGW